MTSLIKINIQNDRTYKINLDYNSNTTFDDLLEYVSYYLSNICPCYKFFYLKNENYYYENKEIEINGNEKLNKYLKNYNNNFSLNIPNKVCKCNEYVKNLYNKSKISIINDLIEIDKYKNDYKNQLDSIRGIDIISKYLKGEEEMKYFENENEEKKKEVDNLKSKIKDFNKTIQSYKDTENNLQEIISELKRKLEEFNKEEEIFNNKEKKLKEEIETLNFQIEENSKKEKNYKDIENKLKKEIETLNFQIEEKSKKEKNYKVRENKLNKEIDQLKKQIKIFNENEKFLKEKEEQLYENKENLKNEKALYNLTHNQLKIDKEKGNIIGNEKPEKENKNFTRFYDVIIDIQSIKDINKGWPIKMNERGEKNYNKYKNDKIIKIGVIGNSNKGKSFLLSKISKIDLPSGYSIKTEGLSIKYPELEEYKDRKIVLLDSAGLETPVLNEKSSNIINNNNNQKESDVNEKSSDTTNNNNNQKEKDFFKEKSREKLITELFLQNYIINNSDILIIVIGILTYSEQKLLNKIKTEIIKTKKTNKIKTDKPLILIIHNLMTYTLVEQIEEYIKDILLNCSTFTLVEGHKTSTSKETKKGKYFYEESNELKIFHLIYANEGSKAGDYYNNFTLNYIEQTYQSITNLTSFDVVETIKERLKSISSDIIEKTENQSEIEFEKKDNEMIKLKQPSNVTLKKCFIDELGFSNLKANGFEPTYNYYIKDNQYLILKVESPGNSELEAVYEEVNGYKFIKLNGKKKKDKEPKDLNEKNADNTREFGDFFLNIPLKFDDPDIHIQNSAPKMEQKRGVIIAQFNLDKKPESAKLTINEDDEL